MLRSPIITVMIAAARKAARSLVRDFGEVENLQVSLKGPSDFVSSADRHAEDILYKELNKARPTFGFVMEERGKVTGSDPSQTWVVDPLDGTTNFLQGLPVWAVSVACRRGSEILAGVVLDPQGGNVFAAARGGGAFWNGRRMRVSDRPTLSGAFLATGYPFRAKAALDLYLGLFRRVFTEARAIRRCGAAALDLAYVAAGVYDGFFEFRLSPWDIAAGSLLIEQAGGVLSDLDGGDRYLASGNVLAGNPGVHAGLLAVARDMASEAELDRLVP